MDDFDDEKMLNKMIINFYKNINNYYYWLHTY